MATDKSRLYGGRKKPAAPDEEGKSKEGRGLFHNSWLEGYTTHTEIGPDNKKRTVSTYEGAYYIPDAPGKKLVLLKIAYTLLFVLSTCLFVLAAAAEIQGNYQKVLALLQAVDLVALLWLLRKLLSYYVAGRRMTVGEYKNTSKSLIRTAKVAAISFAATAVVDLALLFLSVPGERSKTVLCAALYVCCGLCMAAIFRLEKGLNYTVECPHDADQEESPF